MEILTVLLSSISIANIVVLAVLIGIFIKSYAKTKAQFPLAMMVFCGFFALHNLISSHAYFTLGEMFSDKIFLYLLGIHGTELAGLLIFLKIAYQ